VVAPLTKETLSLRQLRRREAPIVDRIYISVGAIATHKHLEDEIMNDLEQQTPWRLSIGIHSGTIMSRDSGIHTVKFDDPTAPLESLADCIECAKAWEANYRSFGYYIWFATAIAPDGAKHDNLVRSVSYR
jgi:hypothetical protein